MASGHQADDWCDAQIFRAPVGKRWAAFRRRAWQDRRHVEDALEGEKRMAVGAQYCIG